MSKFTFSEPEQALRNAATAAIESAAQRLRVDPLALATALKDGGVAELVEAVKALRKIFTIADAGTDRHAGDMDTKDAAGFICIWDEARRALDWPHDDTAIARVSALATLPEPRHD